MAERSPNIDFFKDTAECMKNATPYDQTKDHVSSFNLVAFNSLFGAYSDTI
jgi:hypothetical protein